MIDIERLAREAGIAADSLGYAGGSMVDLHLFAALVRNEVLEEAAKFCDDIRHPWGYSSESQEWIKGTDDCAHAIRALKTTSQPENDSEFWIGICESLDAAKKEQK